MKKRLAAVALAIVSLTIPAAAVDLRPNRPALLPAPPSEPICIVIMGKVICW